MFERVFVKGAAIIAFKNSCISLKYFTEESLYKQLDSVTKPQDWYPGEILMGLIDTVCSQYEQSDNILELIGFETLNLHAEQGMNPLLVQGSLDFLKLQKESQGYYSMVRGLPDDIGEFTLSHLDEEKGKAEILDTTPFPPSFAKGLLLSGLTGPGDLRDVTVSYADKVFSIDFQMAALHG